MDKTPTAWKIAEGKEGWVVAAMFEDVVMCYVATFAHYYQAEEYVFLKMMNPTIEQKQDA